MQRITITIEDELLATLDVLMQRRGYASRSEAIRDLLRDANRQAAAADAAAPCVATLSYVFDHETRALAQRLTQAHHHHHDLSVASLHVHLDHDACLEVSVLRGPAGAVRQLADSITSQRGVRHFSLHQVPVTETLGGHSHGHGRRPHRHTHA